MAANSFLSHISRTLASWPSNHTAWACCLVTCIATLGAGALTQTVQAPAAPTPAQQISSVPAINVTVLAAPSTEPTDRQNDLARNHSKKGGQADQENKPALMVNPVPASECTAQALRLRECNVEPEIAVRYIKKKRA